MPEQEQDYPFSAEEVAYVFAVTPVSVYSWIRSGLVRRVSRRARRYRIPASEVYRLVTQFGNHPSERTRFERAMRGIVERDYVA